MYSLDHGLHLTGTYSIIPFNTNIQFLNIQTNTFPWSAYMMINIWKQKGLLEDEFENGILALPFQAEVQNYNINIW